MPSSELAKIAFVDSMNTAGPIIRSVPSLGTNGFTFQQIWGYAAKTLAGIAAAVAIGLGVWAVLPAKKPAALEFVAARHELLKKVVATNAALARTSDPKARIATLSDLAGNLGTETKEMLNAADAEDFASLATMYEEVVNKGLVNQARQLNPLTMHRWRRGSKSAPRRRTNSEPRPTMRTRWPAKPRPRRRPRSSESRMPRRWAASN